MKFLKYLFSKSEESAKVESATYQKLARFLLSARNYSVVNQSVKSTAYMPDKHGELSTFGIDDLSEQEILDLGRIYVASVSNRKLRGAGLTHKESFLKHKLILHPDNKPPRHVNITGWPTEKEKIKLIAIELASEAELVLLNATSAAD